MTLGLWGIRLIAIRVRIEYRKDADFPLSFYQNTKNQNPGRISSKSAVWPLINVLKYYHLRQNNYNLINKII